ncbi:HpcH/HpaI aldolase/citrate lyase family protein [Chloroflexota bacterium]
MTFRPKENRILAALEKGEVPLGMQVYTGNPSMIEILAYTGFDYYMLDMEHSRVNVETMEHCIRAADAAGITTVVRVTENNPSLIRHAMEVGALGVVVPHVETAEEARRAVEAIRYPPEGKCGMCGCIRSAGYKGAGYMEYSNENVMLIPLLEDKNGIENAEEIFAQLKPGLDAVGIGRGDLSASLRTKPGEVMGMQHPYISEAYDKVVAISRKRNIPIIDNVFGPEDAKTMLDRGINILLYMIDQWHFYNVCEDIVRTVKGLQPYHTR